MNDPRCSIWRKWDLHASIEGYFGDKILPKIEPLILENINDELQEE